MGQAAVIELMEPRTLLAADFALLADIFPGSQGSSIGESFAETVVIGDWLYFTAVDGVHGRELWRTDGTPENTEMVADILPGSASSDPRHLLDVNGTLYFSAITEQIVEPGVETIYRYSTMKTDGTAAGTVVVVDWHEQPGWNLPLGAPTPRFAIDDIVFLYGGASGFGSIVHSQLWRTDGTPEGTFMLHDDLDSVGDAVVFNGKASFVERSTEGSSSQLWISDGTIEGTTVHPDFVTMHSAVVYKDALYFGGRAVGANDSFLWRLESGAETAERIFVEHRDGPRAVSELSVVGDKLYFQAGSNLWRSQGTAETTFQITASNLQPETIVDVDGTAYFTTGGTSSRRLWRSDGSSRDTIEVASKVGPQELTPFGGLVFFTAPSGISGTQNTLYVSNGRGDAGTSRVSDFLDVMSTIRHQRLIVLGDRLLLLAENETFGQEWFYLTLGDSLGTPQITGPEAINSDRRPTITWTAVEDTNHYEVWIKHQSSGDHRFFVDGVVGNSYTADEDMPLGFYSVWVRALGINGSTNGAWTSQHNFRVSAAVTLVTPELNQNTSRPVIEWEPLTGAAHYDVWIDRLDNPTSQYVRETAVPGTSFTPAEDFPIGRYRIWVRGVTATGEFGLWSTQATFHIAPAPVPAETQSTFGPTPTIEWSAVTGAQSYEVYLTNSTGGILIEYERNITGLSWTPSTLPSGDYQYWVLAVGEFGTRSLWSAPVQFSTRGKTIMLTPHGTVPGFPYPLFSWRAVEGAVRYELWANLVNQQQGVINHTQLFTNSVSEPSSPQPPPPVLPAGTYRVWVRAISSTGVEGPWSDSVVFVAVPG